MEEVKLQDFVKPIFEYIYPDLNGYSFYCVFAWEFSGLINSDITWIPYIRLIHARYVIFGVIIEQFDVCANIDSDDWDKIVPRAQRISEVWAIAFKDFQKKYQEARKTHPTGNLSWDQPNRKIVYHGT